MRPDEGGERARTVALEGFFILEHVSFVDEALLGGGDVGFICRGERRLETFHGGAEVHLEGDLTPRRGFDVDGGHRFLRQLGDVVRFDCLWSQRRRIDGRGTMMKKSRQPDREGQEKTAVGGVGKR